MVIENTTIPDLTIVGGGFAGLAAALRLQKAGVKIRLVEKRPFFGGRAYSFKDSKSGEWVDNGQHLLMGAYRETLDFLRELGTLDSLDIQSKLRVTMISPGAAHTLDCPKLPAPFHLAAALFKMKGLGFKDKLRMLGLVRACQSSESSADLDGVSVAEFLSQHGQTEAATRILWEPITLATLNEPLSQASARLFKEVLKLSLLSSNTFDSRMILPKLSFQELYIEPAQKYLQERGVSILFQKQLMAIEKNPGYFVLHLNNGESIKSKKVLLAMPPDALKKVLQVSGDALNHYPQLDCFQSSPIISINLWFEKPLEKSRGFIDEKFVGLINSPIHWIFDKSLMSGSQTPYLSMVISGAYDLARASKEQLLELALKELRVFYPYFKEMRTTHSQVIKEYNATYSGRLGLDRYRPAVTSAVEGLYLAGDWIHTELPATIESAVRSGNRAAEAILEQA